MSTSGMLAPHRLLGATIVALDCRPASADRPFGADVLAELTAQGLLGRVLWSTDCEVGQVDARAFRALAAGGLLAVRLDLGTPTGPDRLRAAMEAVHTLYQLGIMVEYDFDLFGPAPRFSSVLGRASFLRALVSDGSTPATFRLSAVGGSPWLSAYQRRLADAVAPWLDDGGLAGRLRDAWAELAVAERLLRAVSGAAAHRIALQRLTMRSNTALLGLVTESAQDFERYGDSDRLDPDVLSTRLAELEAGLLRLHESFLDSFRDIHGTEVYRHAG